MNGTAREEDSGLHDIRALAAGTIQRVSAERPAVTDEAAELAAFAKRPSAVLAIPGAEVTMSTPTIANGTASSPAITPAVATKRRSPWPIVLVGIAAAAGGGFAATRLLAKPAPAPALAPVVTPEVAPMGATPTEVAPTEAAAVPAAAGTDPVTAEAAVTTDKTAARGATDKAARDKTAAKADKADKTDKAAAATAAAPPAVGVAAPVSAIDKATAPSGSSIDDLLTAAAGSEAKPAAPAEPAPGVPPAAGADEVLPEKLSRDDVRAGMASVRAQVQGCYDQFKIAGTYMVKLTISTDGKVSSADYVTDGDPGKLESGTCVVSAIKSATFRKWKGASLTLTYPFKLQ